MGLIYRPIAWILVLSLVLQPALQLVPALYAEEGDAAPKTRRKPPPKRATPAAAQSESEPASAEGAPAAQSASPQSGTNQPTKAADSRIKFKTSLATGGTDPAEVERAKASQVYQELAKQQDLYTEELDILGPDDSSPVLAESVFGQKGKKRINLIADDIEIKKLMDRLATEFKLNIVSKAIAGRQKIKASLYDLPLETVFQVLLEQSGLTYEKRNGIIYLQEGDDVTGFFEERFFKLKPYADADFARKLIENIASTKGKQIIEHKEDQTFFVTEYKRNLDKIEKVLGELGYLEALDPESATLYYHYLTFNYVDQSVVKDIVEKYRSKDGKASLDEKSNRYLVFDTKHRFEMMKAALKFVDVPRGQVFIDVIFVDLTENDSKTLGVDMSIDWKKNEPENADQLVTSLATDVTNFFALKQPNHINNLKVTGLKENSKSNILNNPRLLVLNNEKAVIDVTEKFPYVQNENNNGVIQSNIEQIDIGVKLDVQPRINGNNEVQMKVKPTITVLKEVKIITTKVVDTNQANAQVTETTSEFPITDERSIDTNVVVPSGQTLVIGGLIKETDRKSADKIPGLNKLPILGKLFERRTSGAEKSELFIFITPTIVRNAPSSSSFDPTAGDERLAFFPGKGKKKLPGVKKEADDFVLELSADEKEETEEPIKSAQGEADDMARKPEARDEKRLTARPAEQDKVDFSTFIKKVAALKQKESLASMKRGDEKAKVLKAEKGFENLIEQLKTDIQDEEQNYEAKVEDDLQKKDEQRKKDEQAKIVKKRQMKQQVEDEVVGKRAARISQLLDMWEQSPVDGILADEDLRKAREEERKEREAKKEEERKAAEEAQRLAQQQLKQEEEAAKQEEGQAEEVQSQLIEEQISMDLFSPLDDGTLRQKKLLKVGTFSTGSLSMQDLKSKSKSSSTKPNTKKAPSKNDDGKAPKKPKKRKKKPKKVSFMPDFPEASGQLKSSFLRAPVNSMEGPQTPMRSRMLRPRQESKVLADNRTNVVKPKVESLEARKQKTAATLKTVQVEVTPTREKRTVVESKSIASNAIAKPVSKESKKLVRSSKPEVATPQEEISLSGWEKDFFEKDLARVVFSDIDVQMDSAPVNKPAKRTVAKSEKAARKVVQENQEVRRVARHTPETETRRASKVRPVQSGKQATNQARVKSSDARTQEIFDNLFAESSKGLRSPKARVSQKTKTRPVVSSPDAKTKAIFEELMGSGEAIKGKKTALKRNTKKSLERKEDEFESFLDQMFSNAQQNDQKGKQEDKKAKVAKSKKSDSQDKKAAKAEEIEAEFLNFLEEL